VVIGIDVTGEVVMRTTQLFNVEQAAEALNIGVPTLYRWCREGRVPCVRLSSRALRFDPAALERLIGRMSSEPREYSGGW
jgi:excisionase family DNA binding protein